MANPASLRESCHLLLAQQLKPKKTQNNRMPGQTEGRLPVRLHLPNPKPDLLPQRGRRPRSPHPDCPRLSTLSRPAPAVRTTPLLPQDRSRPPERHPPARSKQPPPGSRRNLAVSPAGEASPVLLKHIHLPCQRHLPPSSSHLIPISPAPPSLTNAAKVLPWGQLRRHPLCPIHSPQRGPEAVVQPHHGLASRYRHDPYPFRSEERRVGRGR